MIPIQDRSVEGLETVTLRVQASDIFAVDPASASVTIYLRDDDVLKGEGISLPLGGQTPPILRLRDPEPPLPSPSTPDPEPVQ